MKILVTGSSGFIGFHLTKRLIQDGHLVVGIDNHNDYYDVSLKELRNKELLCKNFKFYECDINNIKINEKNFDAVINLAAQAGVRVSPKKQFLYKHSNVNGFKSVVNFCLENKITKLIYASSSSVYSDENSEKFLEDYSILEPKSIYGSSKLSNEIHASELSNKENLSIVGLRFFSVYGPFGRPDMAYFHFTDALKNNRTIELNNAGDMSRDMTYIDDVIDGVSASLDYIFQKNTKCDNEIFNLGNDYPIKTLDLLKTLEKKLKIKAKIKIKYTENEAFRTHADIAKAKNLLGYEPKVSFNEGIDLFLDWHKKYEK